MGEWRDIATAPRDGSFVLLHVPVGLESGEVTVGAYWTSDERAPNGRFQPGNWDGWLGMDADVMSSWCDPTHWQPMPAPPATTLATKETGLGKTSIYEMINAGEIETSTIGTRRLVLVRSLLSIIDPTYKATYKSGSELGGEVRTATEVGGHSKQRTNSVPASKYGRRRLLAGV